MAHPFGHFIGVSLPVFFAIFRSSPFLAARLLSTVAIGLSLALWQTVKGMFVARGCAATDALARGCYPIKALCWMLLTRK